MNKRKYELFLNDIYNQEKEIILLFNKNFNSCILERLDEDEDIVLYFHHTEDSAYLINYDYISQEWYLSLINKKNSEKIKEIFNGPYNIFIDYIKKSLN